MNSSVTSLAKNVKDVSFGDPFFDEISKYSIRFATPVLFGESPYSSDYAALRNGTATLLKLRGRFLAVTCQHVLKEYRYLKLAGPMTFFQIGHVLIDPDKQIGLISSTIIVS